MTELSASETELLDAILALLRERGTMSSAELADALDEDEAYVDDLLMSIDSDEFVWLADERWSEVLSLVEGRVVTHRLTADEVRHDLLTASPDLGLVHLLPETARRLPNGEHLHSVFPGLAEPDQRDVPDEVRHEGGSIVLPVGSLAALGVEPGNLVGLTVSGSGVDLRRVESAELGDGQLIQQALVGLLDDKEHPSFLEPALLTVCADLPEAFRSPVVPVADLIAAAGLMHEGDYIASPGFPLAEYEERTALNSFAAQYELAEAEAHAAMVLVQHAYNRTRRSPAVVAADLPLLTDPRVAIAVASTFRLSGADVLLGLADELLVQAGHAVRPALHWLRAQAYEGAGDVLAAEEALRAAERLDPDWPLTLLDLARYASDRGDAVRALGLLRRADPYEDAELEELLEDFRPVAGPVVGRNDPCWCGSGRKFKQCHLHRAAERPLSDRARWLWHKARRHLEDGGWPYQVDDVLAERTAYAEDDDKAFADDPLVTDAVLFEGGAFAEFLAVRGDLLPADERLLAEQWLLVDRSVFEVDEVRRGKGVTLRDVRTGDRHDVAERTGSTTLRPGQLICARVVPAGDTTQILGGIEPVRPRDRDELLELLDSEPGPAELVAFLTRRFAPPTVALGLP